MGGLPLTVKHPSGKFTVRDNIFVDKITRMILIEVNSSSAFPIDPAQGMEVCIENCNYTVEDAPLETFGAAASGRLPYDGCSIAVTGNYANPSGISFWVRTKNVLDILKEVTFKNCQITGGERGLVYSRPGFNAGYPGSYVPAETEPYRLRSDAAGELLIHISDDTVINNIYDLKLEERGNWSLNSTIVDVFGDRTFVTTDPIAEPELDVTVDNVPTDGVPSPADVTRPGQGTFEVKTEYRLVTGGIPLEFVPPTSVDILTEDQKEIINPRIPASLVGVLEIRFLARALDRLGDSLISLFGVIR
jgi:hypothetical protein